MARLETFRVVLALLEDWSGEETIFLKTWNGAVLTSLKIWSLMACLVTGSGKVGLL